MVFNREWSQDEGAYVTNRDRTGPPIPAPQTGTVVAEDGSVVAQSATINITPATPVHVNLPSPNEPIITADGKINHRWWRFFNELYLRTGGVVDNINRVPTSLLGAGSHGQLAFTGYAPSVELTHIRQMPTGSLGFTGLVAEPAISSPVEAPLVGSIAFTGYIPTIKIA